jgi:hypothetical protein
VASVPFFIWAAMLAISSTVIGVQWDISWHRSIGRDAFWSPPHIAIYLGGVLAGLTSGYLILSTTFAGTRAARAASVRIWGFRGPLGAFISAWGGIAMLASAPFDNWWHNTYGLDVKILSPPHSVLALGIVATQLGALMLVAGLMNRAIGAARPALTTIFLGVGGFLLVGMMTFAMERTGRALLHTGVCYRWVASIAPLLVIGIGRSSGHRFGMTLVAGGYSILMLLMLWLFPLVPATPKMGPVYFQVTHLMPAGFPLLLIIPALVLDLVVPRVARLGVLTQAVVLGGLFILVFVPVQWVFASFLMSPWARNWFFGSHYFGYSTQRGWHEFRYVFNNLNESPLAFRMQLGLAAAIAVLTARLGLAWAGFLRELRR